MSRDLPLTETDRFRELRDATFRATDYTDTRMRNWTRLLIFRYTGEPWQHSRRRIKFAIFPKGHIAQDCFEGRIDFEVFAPFVDVHDCSLS